jgi:hypothetical protein
VKLIGWMQIASFGLAMITFIMAALWRNRWRIDMLAVGLAFWALAHLLNVWGSP